MHIGKRKENVKGSSRRKTKFKGNMEKTRNWRSALSGEVAICISSGRDESELFAIAQRKDVAMHANEEQRGQRLAPICTPHFPAKGAQRDRTYKISCRYFKQTEVIFKDSKVFIHWNIFSKTDWDSSFRSIKTIILYLQNHY